MPESRQGLLPGTCQTHCCGWKPQGRKWVGLERNGSGRVGSERKFIRMVEEEICRSGTSLAVEDVTCAWEGGVQWDKVKWNGFEISRNKSMLDTESSCPQYR